MRPGQRFDLSARRAQASTRYALAHAATAALARLAAGPAPSRLSSPQDHPTFAPEPSRMSRVSGEAELAAPNWLICAKRIWLRNRAQRVQTRLQSARWGKSALVAPSSQSSSGTVRTLPPLGAAILSLTSPLMPRPNDRYALAGSMPRTAAGSRHGGHRGKCRRDSGSAACLRVGSARGSCDGLAWQELPATGAGQAASARRVSTPAGQGARAGRARRCGRDR
jgi:hypothetical protein